MTNVFMYCIVIPNFNNACHTLWLKAFEYFARLRFNYKVQENYNFLCFVINGLLEWYKGVSVKCVIKWVSNEQTTTR